jgi:hypothetical protein
VTTVVERAIDGHSVCRCRHPRSSSFAQEKLASVGSKKSRTGHLVEDLFFYVVIVVEIDGQISRRAVAVVVRRRVGHRSSLVVVVVYSAEDIPMQH